MFQNCLYSNKIHISLNTALIYKDYEIGICCFSSKHAALRGKNKDGLAQNQYNVSEWGDMSICRLLFQ